MMEYTVVMAITFVSTFVGMALVAVLMRRRQRRVVGEVKQLLDAIEKRSEELAEEAIQQKTRAEKAERQATVHREANERFEAQRDDAWKRYHAAGTMAGNAQARMLGTIEQLAVVVNQYRQKEGKEPLKMDPSLSRIYEEFKREHVELDFGEQMEQA